MTFYQGILIMRVGGIHTVNRHIIHAILCLAGVPAGLWGQDWPPLTKTHRDSEEELKKGTTSPLEQQHRYPEDDGEKSLRSPPKIELCNRIEDALKRSDVDPRKEVAGSGPF
jgi:hypothetical protein